MFDKDIIKTIFDEDGVIKKINPKYKKRPSQIEVTELMYEALNRRVNMISQCSTGTGKSIAYLSASMQYLIENPGEKVLIVTSGISLQEQLIKKDLPCMIKVFDSLYPDKNVKNFFNYTVLKGISNYICKDKYELLCSVDDITMRDQLKHLKDFMESNPSGDLERVDFNLNGEIRKLITTESDLCAGKHCKFDKDCYVNSQKKKAKSSNIVVTNYHMLMASLLSGSSIFEDVSIIIFDEAHEAVNVVRSYSAKEVSSSTVRYISRRLSELKGKSGSICNSLDSLNLEEIAAKSDLFFATIHHIYKAELGKMPKLIERQDQFPNPNDLKMSIEQVVKALDTVLAKARYLGLDECEKGIIEESSQLKQGEFEKRKQGIIDLSNSIKKTCLNLVDMISNVNEILSDNNKVLWIENGINDQLKIGLKSIDISSIFSSYFLENNNIVVVLTSATLSVDNNFDYIKMQLGFSNNINKDKDLIEYIGETPFDLKSQELWYLPESALPGNHKEFDKNMIIQIADILRQSNGGALCLFTSIKNLNLAAKELPVYIKDQAIFTQHDMSKSNIIEKFRLDINSNLLASKSFYTGVDVPGESLRVVIIDKLPFANSADPVQQVLSKRPNAFYKYSLPEMIIDLKQIVGRGVRSESCRAVICILDGRIETARYKGTIFNSLKYSKTSTRSLDDIKAFLGN